LNWLKALKIHEIENYLFHLDVWHGFSSYANICVFAVAIAWATVTREQLFCRGSLEQGSPGTAFSTSIFDV